MTDEELFREANPRCSQCDQPIERTEQRWHTDEDGRWRISMTNVCSNNHRVVVFPIMEDD